MPRAAVSILLLQVVSNAQSITLKSRPCENLRSSEKRTQVAMVAVVLGGVRQRLQLLARIDKTPSSWL